MRSMVYNGMVSVRLSVCLSHSPAVATVGPATGDIDRLLPGAQQQ